MSNNNDDDKPDKNLETNENGDELIITNSDARDSNRVLAAVDDDSSRAAGNSYDNRAAGNGDDNQAAGNNADSPLSDAAGKAEEDDDQDELDQQKFLQWVRNRFGKRTKRSRIR